MPRLIERHPDGREEWLHWDPAGRFHIEHRADLQAHVDWCKAMDTSPAKGWSPTREWKLVASIPPVIQLKWIQLYGADPLKRGNEDLLERVLNDPEWRYLRIGGMI